MGPAPHDRPATLRSAGALPTPPAPPCLLPQVLWELATWRLPYEDAHLNTFQIISLKQRPGALPAGPLPCYDQYCALMAACLAHQPAARPSFEDAVQQLG